MTRRFTTTLSVNLGGDIPDWEGEVTVSFEFTPGTPETGAGYMADPHKYDPGSPDLIEDIRVELVDGKPGPWGTNGNQWSRVFAENIVEQIDEADLIEAARDRLECERPD